MSDVQLRHPGVGRPAEAACGVARRGASDRPPVCMVDIANRFLSRSAHIKSKAAKGERVRAEGRHEWRIALAANFAAGGTLTVPLARVVLALRLNASCRVT